MLVTFSRGPFPHVHAGISLSKVYLSAYRLHLRFDTSCESAKAGATSLADAAAGGSVRGSVTAMGVCEWECYSVLIHVARARKEQTVQASHARPTFTHTMIDVMSREVTVVDGC